MRFCAEGTGFVIDGLQIQKKHVHTYTSHLTDAAESIMSARTPPSQVVEKHHAGDILAMSCKIRVDGESEGTLEARDLQCPSEGTVRVGD